MKFSEAISMTTQPAPSISNLSRRENVIFPRIICEVLIAFETMFRAWVYDVKMNQVRREIYFGRGREN